MAAVISGQWNTTLLIRIKLRSFGRAVRIVFILCIRSVSYAAVSGARSLPLSTFIVSFWFHDTLFVPSFFSFNILRTNINTLFPQHPSYLLRIYRPDTQSLPK
jgi:hypothetical protein